MPTYDKAPEEITELCQELLERFSAAHDQMYQRIIDSRLKIDLMLAYANRDEGGNKINDAITHQGHKALGLCKIISLKDRAAGLGDVRILLDGDEWEKATQEAKESLLDHELFHIIVRTERDGVTIKQDDLWRPMVKMRKHEIEVGMFATIAARHGERGIERRDFRAIVDKYGQYMLPEIFGEPSPEFYTEGAVESFRRLQKFATENGATMTISVGK